MKLHPFSMCFYSIMISKDKKLQEDLSILRIENDIKNRKQMQIVLDLLPKLLSLCTSTTIIIDSDIEGGGVSMSEFRV